ncbi:MAG: tRNA uridine-5-carboxymethylaminomethyl(34) synthesis enzyme MnmG [Rickettsiales bacterium]|jgi:tRNA uridine 5-carboxymethylaminomethyl modification enzyme|nr:tRNA uridine-5-carboxymethylaminomethyl(34) synthesis enzyme MnmG [Rickettsiales bacterium]
MYQTIVIGAGNAGVEAAAVVARMGKEAALISFKLDNIGELSCNPSIGGVAKGIIVREIDALDGLMGKCADMSGTYFKVLNASKGPAVWSPRCQVDRKLYKQSMRQLLAEYKNIDVIESEVVDIIVTDSEAKGVVLTDGTKIFSNSVIVTTGTFLNGVVHVGHENWASGRINEKPSNKLAEFFKLNKFDVGRLKTGTPARLDKDTINFSELRLQVGDVIPQPFSYLNDRIDVPQIECRITHTNTETHKIIFNNLKKSALYGGNITGRGPRYCPSIEDKVVRFADKEEHQIFLEVEGIDSNVVYPNGISTSLPADVQEQFIHSIKGLENCKILRYGYAIEYDYVNPLELKPTLETKRIRNLFLAGQINGTTGYEEAGGQGLVAGINSVSSRPFILDRESSYIGVMIDDLTTLGTNEPYRMFTSRAEYRLFLRADNADFRLTTKGEEHGCVSQKRLEVSKTRILELNRAKNILKMETITPNKLENYGINVKKDGVAHSAYELLGYPGRDMEKLEKAFPTITTIDEKIKQQLVIEAMYESYIKRQNQDIELLEKEKKILIPADFDYDLVGGLTNEIKEKLKLHRPYNLEVAGRIMGVTPASIINIVIALKKMSTQR